MRLSGWLAVACVASNCVGFAGAQSTAPASQHVPYRFSPVTIVAGGFIPGIVFHPGQKGLAYARTDIGGAYRWDADTGKWIPLNDWTPAETGDYMGVESIGLDPSDPQKLYLAVGRYTKSWAGNGAILRSSNQGRSFEMTKLPIQVGGNEDGREAGERIAVDPNDGKKLYFGSRNDGLWLSTDAGKTWAREKSFPGVSTNQIGVVFEIFDKASGAAGKATPVIYAGVSTTGASMFRSADAGATWQPVSDAPKGLLPIQAVLAPNRVLYVTYADAPGPNGMMTGQVWRMSLDDGKWKQITPRTPNQGGEPTFGYAGVSVDWQHPETLVVSTMDHWNGGDDIFRSTDGGKHWTGLKERSAMDASLSPWLIGNKPTADFGHWLGAVAIDPFDSGHILYGTGATMWGTHDAAAGDGATSKEIHWTVAAAGIEETAVITLLSPPTGDAHLLSGVGDIGGFRHVDFAVSPHGGAMKYPQLSNTDTLDYAGLSPESQVRVGRAWGPDAHGANSVDGGKSWHKFPTEPEGGKNGGNAAISADGQLIFWSVRDGMLSSTTDQGEHWKMFSGAPKNSEIVADKVMPRQFYLYNGETGDFFVTLEDGTRFVKASVLAKGGRLVAVPGKAAELWLATWDSGLFHARPGKPFTQIAGVTQARSIGFGKPETEGGPPVAYLVGKVNGVGGIFRSTDDGATWVEIDDDQHHFGDVGAVTGDPRIFGRVYFGTNGRGAFYGDPEK